METDVRRRVNWSVGTRVLHRLHREQSARKYVLPRVVMASELETRHATIIMSYQGIGVTPCVRLKWIRNVWFNPSVVQVRVIAGLISQRLDLPERGVVIIFTIGTGHTAKSTMPNIKLAPNVLVNAAQRVRKRTWTTRLAPQRPTRQ